MGSMIKRYQEDFKVSSSWDDITCDTKTFLQKRAQLQLLWSCGYKTGAVFISILIFFTIFQSVCSDMPLAYITTNVSL